MNLRDIILLNKISQIEKNKYYMISLILKSKIIKFIETESRTEVARGWGMGEMRIWWSKGTDSEL